MLERLAQIESEAGEQWLTVRLRLAPETDASEVALWIGKCLEDAAMVEAGEGIVLTRTEAGKWRASGRAAPDRPPGNGREPAGGRSEPPLSPPASSPCAEEAPFAAAPPPNPFRHNALPLFPARGRDLDGAILRLLEERGSLPVAEIAETLAVTSACARNRLKQMQGKSLVHQCRHASGLPHWEAAKRAHPQVRLTAA